MKKIADIIQAIFVLYVAWYGFSYYTGRVNYTGEREERRKKRVEQYGWIFVFAITISLITGLGLLFKIAATP